MTRLALAPLAVALAAISIPAFAETNEVQTPYYSSAPLPEYYVTRDYVYVPVERDYYYEPAPTLYAYTPDTTSYYVPSNSSVYYEGPVTIYGTSGNDDAAINSDVQDAIASDPTLNGHIDADTYRGNVTLQGLVSTPGQARRAGYDARGVDGVNHVDNEVQARVGSY